MIYLVTFGKMKTLKKEKDFQKDLDNFVFAKKILVTNLIIGMTDYDFFPKIEISQIDNIIKEKLAENSRKEICNAFVCFMVSFGLSFDLLSKEEKNQLLTNKDYSYENIKKIILNIYNDYIKKGKENCPSQIDICFKERCFISYCHFNKKIIQKNNFLDLIKNYFILDKEKELYSNYRDKNLFEDIQKRITDAYPEWKDKYGINKYIDKFFSFFDKENDYNNSFLKNKMTQYYDNKKKEKENNNKKNNKEEDEYSLLLKNNGK